MLTANSGAIIPMLFLFNPRALFLIMAHGRDQVLLPYEYAYYLIYFSFGLIYLKDFLFIVIILTSMSEK